MKRLSRIQVYGGKTLHGTITIQGSKNAALPMMAESLLHRGVSVLEACPKISDVFCMEEILQSLGAITWWKDHDLYLDCTRAEGTEISGIHTCRMRSSVILLGALLGRKGAGTMGYPGGCIIGKRPIDLHLYVLNCLGAKVKETEECLSANCPRLTGSIICFPARSVGATEQAILAAVLAGVTVFCLITKEDKVTILYNLLYYVIFTEWGKRAGDLLALSVSSGYGSPNPGRRYRMSGDQRRERTAWRKDKNSL